MVTSAERMTIGEVSSLYNVTFRTLRFYEERGLIAPLRIGTSRFYSPKDMVRVELILKGKKLGFSLEEIRALISSAPSEEPATPSAFVEHLPQADVTRRIAQLEQQREALIAAIQELQDALKQKFDELNSTTASAVRS